MKKQIINKGVKMLHKKSETINLVLDMEGLKYALQYMHLILEANFPTNTKRINKEIINAYVS